MKTHSHRVSSLRIIDLIQHKYTTLIQHKTPILIQHKIPIWFNTRSQYRHPTSIYEDIDRTWYNTMSWLDTTQVLNLIQHKSQRMTPDVVQTTFRSTSIYIVFFFWACVNCFHIIYFFKCIVISALFYVIDIWIS